MTLAHRRLLYLFFFLLFFIFAPLVIFLAEGYKIDLKNWQFQKTGVLFLESKPNKADIFLNGQKTTKKTAAQLKQIPGEYLVEVKKDGYLSWKKNLKINSGLTTFAQYIRLFKENIINEKFITEKISAFSEEKNGQFAFSASSANTTKLFLLDLNGENYKEITSLNFEIKKIIMDADGINFLVSDGASWWQVIKEPLTKNKIKPLIISPNENIKKIIFDPNNSNTAYFLSNFGLKKINLSLTQTELLIAPSLIDFYFSENKIYYLKKRSAAVELISFPINNYTQELVVANLPLSTDYKFINSPAGLLTILNQEKNTINFFDNTKKIFSQNTVWENVNKISWDKSGKSFIFGNDFEIWTFESEKNTDKKQLISRLGSTIKNFWWYPVPTHLFYTTSDGFFVTELIANDFVRDTINLSALNKINSLWVTEKGDKIYWLDEQQNFFVSQVQ